MLNASRQRGFNLVEAMVTVSVLALLVAAALPSMVDWIRSTRVRGIAESTLNGLQRARVEAMKRNQVVTFWLVSPSTTHAPDGTCALSSTSAAWVISMDDPTGECDEDPSPTDAPRIVEKYGPGQSASDITVSAVGTTAAGGTATASSVSFNGFGQVERGATWLSRVDIRHSTEDSARQLRVQISGNGSVRMCDIEVTDAADPRRCN